MPRLPIALLLAVGVLAPASTAGAATCAGADTPISADSLDQAKASVVCLVNVERVARGLPALTTDAHLALAAQRHTDDMVARNYFSHTAPAPAPYGTDPGARITAAGYDWWFYGENIAAGYDTPAEVMAGWMASEGHCSNILDPQATQIGVGVAPTAATLPDQAGGTWTQDFGRPSRTDAPSTLTAPQNGCPYQALTDAASVVLPASPAPAATPAPSTSAATAPAPSPAPAPSSPAPATPVRVVWNGSALVLAGHVSAPDGTPVTIAVQRNHHTIRRVRARAHHHAFRARLRVARRSGHYRLRVVCGTLDTVRVLR